MTRRQRLIPLSAVALVVIALAPPARAAVEAGHPLLYHGTAHDMLYAVATEGNQAIAVGDFGLIVDSTDGGATWKAQSDPLTDLALLTVARNQAHCIVAGQEGVVLISPDCQKWTRIQLSGNPRIMDIALTAGGTAYAVGGFGTLLKSTDWGRTWSPLPIDWTKITDDGEQPHLYRVHVAANGEVAVVGEFELVLVSDDGGGHWSVRHKHYRSLFALAFTPNGSAFAAGQEGLILKSSDHGATWSELSSGTKTVLTSIVAVDDAHLIASGIHTVLYSDDAGKTWRPYAAARLTLGWDQDLAVGGERAGHPEVLLVGSQADISALPAAIGPAQ